jgi:8-oxo-dGTP pyrophosphatase MutT (NUDIX family)
MFARAKSLKYKKSTQTVFGQFCINCGKNNHIFTQCNEPYSSYGVICFHKSKNVVTGSFVPRVMMVCRKHSVYYTEFLRGKYDVNNTEYLVKLFSRMTESEVDFICKTTNFELLRADLGLDSINRRAFRLEYETSELKFNYILNLGILNTVINSINRIFNRTFQVNFSSRTGNASILEELQQTNTAERAATIPNEEHGVMYTEPEWEIPKGKRQNKETDLQCAVREFSEETGLSADNIRIYKNVVPLEEIYTGINGIEYKHIYFIGEILDIPKSLMLTSSNGQVVDGHEFKTVNHEQEAEVSRVKLMDIGEILQNVRSFHVSKRSILQKAFYIISSMHNFFYI